MRSYSTHDEESSDPSVVLQGNLKDPDAPAHSLWTLNWMMPWNTDKLNPCDMRSHWQRHSAVSFCIDLKPEAAGESALDPSHGALTVVGKMLNNSWQSHMSLTVKDF